MCGRRRTLARLCIRTIRRRGPLGGGRVLLEPGFQGFHTGLEIVELREVVLYRAQIRLDCGGCLLPVLARKGKGPGGIVGWQRLIHHVSRLRKSVHTLTLLIVGKPDDVQWKTLGIDRGII